MRIRILLVALCGLGLAGCASQSEQNDAAGTATRFLDAVTRGDTAAACALLTPRTREDLATSEGQPCRQSLPTDGLGGGPVEHVDTWSDESIVDTRDAALFLTRFGDRWLVSSAGCKPDGDAPYECVVGG